MTAKGTVFFIIFLNKPYKLTLNFNSTLLNKIVLLFRYILTRYTFLFIEMAKLIQLAKNIQKGLGSFKENVGSAQTEDAREEKKSKTT